MSSKKTPVKENRFTLRAWLLLTAVIGIFSYLVYNHPNIPESESILKSKPEFRPKTANNKETETNSLIQETNKFTASDEIPFTEEDLLFTFANEPSLLAFLAAAENAGTIGIQTNLPLLTARFRTSNLEDARLVRSLAKQSTTTEKNHTILIPFPVGNADSYVGAPFHDSALEFIGAPTDREDLGKGIKIAILDTGVQSHLSIENVTIEHIDLIDDEINEFQPHGTAVASLIAGKQGMGVAPGSELLSIRVLDSDGIGDSFTLAKGIVEAVDRGAQIINMSLGGFGPNTVLENAINYARENGVVLVAASGNEGLDILPFPAQYEGVIAVSAIDANATHANFSNQGDGIDIAAPGVGLRAAWKEEEEVLFTGTSASTPLVTSSIAAIMSEFEELDANQAAERLITTANDIGYPGRDLQTGSGTLNLNRALYPTNKDIYDLALADIFIDSNLNDAGEAIVHISVQNRGTETIHRPILKISDNGGFPKTVILNRLMPGEVGSHQLNIFPSPNIANNDYKLVAEAEIGPNRKDAKTSNDIKSVNLTVDQVFSATTQK